MQIMRVGVRAVVVAAIVAGVSLLAVRVAYACEPCALDETLDLQETVAAADLVVIGHKVGEAPLGANPDEHEGPDWIRVRVDEVLKGEADGNRIRVNSWDGMCPYGIVVDDQQTYVMFLMQREAMYDAVNIGCAVTRYPVQNDTVDVNGQSVPLDQFVADLGLTSPAVSDDTVEDEAVSESTSDQTAPDFGQESGSGQRRLCLSVPGVLAGVASIGVLRRKNSHTEIIG